MRLTEALDFYNGDGRNLHKYTHFCPTLQDFKLKKEYKNRPRLEKPKKKKIVEFDDEEDE